MFNIAQIQEGFRGLVGFRQPNDPAYKKIDSDLTLSSSSLYIQRVNALCSLENIYNVAPEFDNFTYPAWVAQSYVIDDIVTKDGQNWKAKEAIVAGDVPGVSTKWRRFSGISDWLREIYEEACSGLIDDLITYKKVNEWTKSFLDNMRLYEGYGMLSDMIIKKGRFVGVKFEIKNQESMTVAIQSIGLQTTQEQAILNIYLYHSSVKQPLAIVPIEISDDNSFSWSDLAMTLNVYAKTNDSAGVFILGYYEDDLAGQAIRKQMNLHDRPCSTCSQYNIRAFNAWSKHMRITAIEVAEAGLENDRTLFDTQFLSTSYDTNFGMNLSIGVYCDLTNLFINNKMLFAGALAKRVALNLLNEIAYNTRLNAISDKTKALAMADINPEGESFKREYFDQIKALNFDFSGFSSECLPCVKKAGIRYGTV